MKRYVGTVLFAVLTVCICARAAVTGTLRGIVHDPDHRPVAGALVSIQSSAATPAQNVTTDAGGAFEAGAFPIGEYVVTVTHDGFSAAAQNVALVSSGSPILHFQLTLASGSQSVTVQESAVATNPEAMTPTTLVSRHQIESTPGADLSNSLAMITAFVPGAWITHDQLHVRGGHQVTWEIDGVPIPDTNIGSSAGPQVDPKDIAYLEVQRGGYSAESGDRTYGVFNAVPRTGFERNQEGELYTTFGTFQQTNDQINYGSHTEKFAYFGSLNGNRSDYGLETPGPDILHDRVWGLGGASTLLYNSSAANQFRFVTSLRRDRYQVPNRPEDQAVGLRDTEHERNSLASFSWIHSFGGSALLTTSPFFHETSTNFDGDQEQQHRNSQYAGAQIAFTRSAAHHDLRAGVFGFAQHEDEAIVLASARQNLVGSGHLEALFLEDQYKLLSWLTLTAGVRATHFTGRVSENEVTPRTGASVRVPHLNWVFRAFWGSYYQAPPLSTVTSTLLNVNGPVFLPLHGERDQEHQFGVSIPVRRWAFELNNYHQRARNYFDHNAIGNSNVFFPLTIQNARFYGWEVTLHSPQLWHRGDITLAYSNAHALASGAVSGGLSDRLPPSVGYFALDHDQRNTLHTTFSFLLVRGITAGGNVYYGSGFSDGNSPGSHLPGHTSVDLTLGKTFRERYALSLTALNATNRRYLSDNSLTFGGTHYADPRQIYAQLRYRFQLGR
jgi:outer membrane receptor protein involved in Fe transport